MLRARPAGRDRSSAFRAVLAVSAVVAFCSAFAATTVLGAPPSPDVLDEPGRTTAPVAAAGGERPDGPVRSLLPGPPVDSGAAAPTRVLIPAIGVDAAVGPLEVDPAGVLQAPADFAATGWWRAGPEPGERGPAVVAGHVDSTVGPAVFFALGDLRPGDEVTLERVPDRPVTFRVDRVERHAKDAFPTAAVYGATPDAQLRLVTCGGAFDEQTGHYADNVVVFASRVV